MDNKNNISNKIFNAIIYIFIGLLVLFIISALSMVLMKGVPNIFDALKSKEIQFSLKLSIYTSIISTAICILFAIPISYGLSRFDFKLKHLVNTIIDIPIALPPLVSGVALLLLFGNTAFGNMLENLGLNFVFDIKGIILAQFFINIPYMIRILKSTISDIDPKIEYVSRTLGCNKIQTFFKITLPLAKSGLTAGIIITWARALGEFGAALMIAGATRMKTETLPISLFLNMSCGNLKYAMASATILIIISVSSLLAFELIGNKNNYNY
jgi:molybdate transport system permease protein